VLIIAYDAGAKNVQFSLKTKKGPELLLVQNLMWQQYMYQDSTSNHPYFVYTPTAYRVGTAVPLLVMLHGCTQTAAEFATGTRMNQLAEQYGFIVVYPEQTRTSNRTLCWNWFKSSNQFRGRGEPAMIAQIVQAVRENTSQWTIDDSRIYVAGASAGGVMAVILGATYPDIFAAIGVHSGAEYRAVTNILGGFKVMRSGGPDPIKQGKEAYDAMGGFKRVVPTIVFHGTHDRIAALANGDQVVQQWMQTNRLASHGLYDADFKNPTTTTSGQVPGGRSYTVYTWKDNKGNEVQKYWKIHGLGHAWSGGNPSVRYTDPQGPNASEAMYRFFMKHQIGEARRNEASLGLRNIRRVLANPLRLLKLRRGE
jgi:poly(hydroxyalkanoate) depolymerase family esterase